MRRFGAGGSDVGTNTQNKSNGCLGVELLASLPDPPLFGLIATFARLLWPVAAATVDLHASPDCWSGLEESCDELEDVNCGLNAYKCGNHVILSPMNHPTLAGSMLSSRSPFSWPA